MVMDEARQLNSKGSFTGYSAGDCSRVESEQNGREMKGVGVGCDG
jgi:hypothetical protein